MHPLIQNSIKLESDAVPPLHDLPVSLVNEIVFGSSYSDDSDDEDTWSQ